MKSGNRKKFPGNWTMQLALLSLCLYPLAGIYAQPPKPGSLILYPGLEIGMEAGRIKKQMLTDQLEYRQVRSYPREAFEDTNLYASVLIESPGPRIAFSFQESSMLSLFFSRNRVCHINLTGRGDYAQFLRIKNEVMALIGPPSDSAISPQTKFLDSWHEHANFSQQYQWKNDTCWLEMTFDHVARQIEIIKTDMRLWRQYESDQELLSSQRKASSLPERKIKHPGKYGKTTIITDCILAIKISSGLSGVEKNLPSATMLGVVALKSMKDSTGIDWGLLDTKQKTHYSFIYDIQPEGPYAYSHYKKLIIYTNLKRQVHGARIYFSPSVPLADIEPLLTEGELVNEGRTPAGIVYKDLMKTMVAWVMLDENGRCSRIEMFSNDAINW